MKRGKEDKSTKFDRLTKLWTEVGINEWTTLLREKQPQSKFTSDKVSIKGCCPFHAEDTPSFYITPEQGIAYCFGCQEHFSNPVEMIAKMCKVKMGEALLIIRRQFSIRGSLSDKFCDRVTAYEEHQELKRKIVDYCCSQLLAAIKLWPDTAALTAAEIYWAKPAIDYLMTRKLGEPSAREISGATPAGADPWGVWDTLCREQLVGVLPPLTSVQGAFGGESEEFKFFVEYTKKYTGDGNRYIGWLILPYHNSPRSISRVKMREPKVVGKKNMVTIEDEEFKEETEDFLGYYGLHYYRALLLPKSPGDQMVHTVCAVEGEFDALSSIAQQVRRGGSPDFITLALSGGSAPSLDELYTLGVSRVRIVADNDVPGEEFTRKVIEKTKETRMSIQVFAWPDSDEMRGVKDPDEAVKVLGYTWWHARMSEDGRFLSLPAWCLEQAKIEIERAAINDVRMSGEITTRWGRHILDAQEREKYVADAATACGVSAEILRDDLTAGDNEETAYIARAAVVICQRFDVIGYQKGEHRKSILHLWDKQKRRIAEVVLNDESGAETFFAAYYGPIDEMLERQVGPLPNTGDGEVTQIHSFKIKNCRHYLSQALLRMSHDIQCIRELEVKRQGIHVVRRTGHANLFAPPRPDVYVVNGHDVFHINYDEDDNMSSSFLAGPTHNKLLFQADGQPWAEDLTLARINEPVDLIRLFNSLHKMIDIGWRWRYQDVDTIFLAAHLMCLSVMNLFKRQTMVFLTAERSSGKSRFLQGLVGKTGFPKINVLEHSVVLNNYSPAGLVALAEGSTLLVCLDEFEQDAEEPQRAAAVRGIWLLLRDMISESPVMQVRSTNTGGLRQAFIRFPTMLAAINPPQSAADETRALVIEPVTVHGRGRPEDILLRDIGEVEIQRTRRELTVGLIPHIQTLMRLQDEVERECSERSEDLLFASSRYLESLYPALTMLKFLKMEADRLGLPAGSVPEYRKFLRDFTSVRKSALLLQETNTKGETLFNAVLDGYFQASNDDSRMGFKCNIRHLLRDLNTVSQINKTMSGVYYDAKMDWLVINWSEAKQSVLREHKKYVLTDPSTLRKFSERSKHYVQASEVARAEVLDRLLTAMGPGHNPNTITIFSIRHILDSLRNMQTGTAHGIVIIPQEVNTQVDLEEAQAFAKEQRISVAKAAAILSAIRSARETENEELALGDEKNLPETSADNEDVV